MRPAALASNRFATIVPTILALLAATVLAGCGGGSPMSGTGTGIGGGTAGTPASSVQIQLSSLTLPSSVVAPITLTAIVLDANNNGLAGRTVTFSVVDNVAQPAFVNNLTPPTGLSDLNGQVTAKLNLGGTTTNRTLTVTATVDGITSPIQTVTVASSSTPPTAAANSIQVLPSSATLLASGAAPVSLTATVLDINNNVIPGKVVSFAVTDPVPVATGPAYISNVAAGGVTDTNGQATAQLNLGANTSNRNITVKVTVDTVIIGTTTVTVAASAAAPAASIQLLLSSGSLPASGAAPVTLTAVVLDANSIGLANKIVSFTVTDNVAGHAFINGISAGGVSDSGGLVTATLRMGADTTPRNLTVTVTVDSVITASATVAVTNAGSPVAQSVQLLASSPTLPSAGASQVVLTAIVLDGNNNAMAGKGVTFKVVDPAGTAFLNNISGNSVTDANGQVTAKLNVGTDKSNRSVTVSITVDAVVTASTTVAITGTSITISGLNSVVFGANLALTAQLKDSSGAVISGKPLTITSLKGNTISASPITTDQNGQIAFSVLGTVSGADTITVAGMGATQSLAITVNGSNFSFTSPAPNASVVINTLQVLTVHWDIAGVNQVNQPILFSATRGTLTAATVNTNASGNASVSISSPSTGVATITASGTGVGAPVTSVNITYITTSAASVTLQAATATIPFNLPGQSTSFTPVTAVVRDVNNNLVQGARVNFQIGTDPSGGQLSSPTATTDVSGTATVNYIAGTTTSGQNAVRIDAQVMDVNNGPPVIGVSASVFLTVRGQALFIRMATDQFVIANTGTYTKNYFALVTDSAGNPSVGTTVVFAIRPAGPVATAYEKGFYSVCVAAGPGCPSIGWYKNVGPFYDCNNEDVNFNGILDPGEDFNNNLQLTPGNVASVNATAVTDATGIAIANVVYIKDFATWATVHLTATITAAGTEYIQSTDFTLPGLAADYTNISIAPPGQTSPFGVNACNFPN